MKKTIFFLLAIICQQLYAQEFMGIAPEGKPDVVLANFQKKGFKLKAKKVNHIQMDGMLNNTPVELFAFFTPVSGVCWKLVVYFPVQRNWVNIKQEYFDYRKVLMDKYGEPEKSYDFFVSPYYEGDGYEMSALAIEKVHFQSFWDNGVAIQISQFKQVKISYENTITCTVMEEEENKIKNKNL